MNIVAAIFGRQLSKEEILKHPDILVLENAKNKKSIGIDKVREAIKFLGQKPYMEEKKAVIVRNAHLFTRQAQNAFLKTLEEPPQYASILLEAPSKGELLETVISRCRQVQIKPTPRKQGKTLAWDKIKRLSAGDKLELAEKLTKKETIELISIIDTWIQEEREALKKGKKDSGTLKTLGTVRKDLKGTNVNAQLALEFLLLRVS